MVVGIGYDNFKRAFNGIPGNFATTIRASPRRDLSWFPFTFLGKYSFQIGPLVRFIVL